MEREVCQNLKEASSREWLETNGLGGFASSTIAGMNTRRYHGLLVAAVQPPAGRMVLLSSLQETLVVDGTRFELGANQYPDTVHPQGYRYLASFRLDPYSVATYVVNGVELERAVCMVHGENTTVVQYALRGHDVRSLRLELAPLLAFRDYHALTHENGALDGRYVEGDGGRTTDDGRIPALSTLDPRLSTPDSSLIPHPSSLSFSPYPALPTLHLAYAGAEVAPAGYWYRRFQYERERERGLDFEEDLFCPCILTFDLTGRDTIPLIASTKPHSATEAASMVESERARRVTATESRDLSEARVGEGRHLAVGGGMREAQGAGPRAAPDLGPCAHNSQMIASSAVPLLLRAADQFLVRRGEGSTVIAGYHWFTDWGRDTMISLPGLTLVTGRFDIARSILLEFSKHVSQGMLPNRFPDKGETPEYNTADATLWYFQAIWEYVQRAPDGPDLARNLWPVLADIVGWHVRGARYGIRMDESDGLLHAGEPGVQLTWMDAKVGDWVVTPRIGKPVEINALWYNTLRVMEQVAGIVGEDGSEYAKRATRAERGFRAAFVRLDGRGLYDVITDQGPDASVRPNQVFAVSLPHSPLNLFDQRRTVRAVQESLLTPFGLRTLAPEDPAYRGRYEGGPLERDGAYHQGTVWPWLLGPFAEAHLKVYGNAERATTFLQPIQDHLCQAGIGSISEIFDGDPPHRPNGCIAQAWSIAEILRVWSLIEKTLAE